jgi:hypothetical protein
MLKDKLEINEAIVAIIGLAMLVYLSLGLLQRSLRLLGMMPMMQK